MAFDWFAPVITLKGVGIKIAEKLEKLQIATLGDLLLHCPYRYEDRTQLISIAAVSLDQFAVVQGQITQVKTITKGKRRSIITLDDETGTLSLLFFNYPLSAQKQWQPGRVLRCFGQIKMSSSILQMIHPEYEIIDETQNSVLPPYLTPIYPSVAGLSQGWLRRTIQKVLTDYGVEHKDPDIFTRLLSPLQQMPSWLEALQTIHSPNPNINEVLVQKQHPAYKRLIIEEFIAYSWSLRQIKIQAQNRKACSLTLNEKPLKDFLAALPFILTAAQDKTWQQIRQELRGQTPMLRLVQGDVGCGKTVVAALAALAAISSNKQVAIMAPTEILAQQHYGQFCTWFTKMGYRCELLTSKLKAKEKRSVKENITLGIAHIVIGTHALFQDDIQFNALGLVIIDEQHRFGVHQRLALQDKGNTGLTPTYPHQLIMTATPIPRTLMMSHYAHLDISTIDSLPPGRKPIVTLTIPHTRRLEIIERIAKVCEKGQQVYWVCTLIAESDVLDCQAAEVTAQALQSLLAPFRIGLIHGKMDNGDKESVMSAFYQGEISILVATTVIEVGVNVPKATLMIIENPERLGLAQLHQLRGRVGRGEQASFCVLLYQAPLSEVAQARLRIMRESSDGFVIAEADLALRGPGEVLGTRQTGALEFKIGDLNRDAELIKLLPTFEEKLAQLPSQHVETIIQRWCRENQLFAKA